MSSDRSDQKLPSYANEKLNLDEKRDFLNEGGERNGASAVEQPKKMWPGEYLHSSVIMTRLAVLPKWIP